MREEQTGHSSSHLHAQVGSHSLVYHVGNAHSRCYLAEVRNDASVKTSEPLRPQDVLEETQGVGLILRQRQLLPQPRLALQLSSHQGQRVGGQLSAARTEGKTCNRRERLYRWTGEIIYSHLVLRSFKGESRAQGLLLVFPECSTAK